VWLAFVFLWKSHNADVAIGCGSPESVAKRRGGGAAGVTDATKPGGRRSRMEGKKVATEMVASVRMIAQALHCDARGVGDFLVDTILPRA
jgi:hypothetical protein